MSCQRLALQPTTTTSAIQLPNSNQMYRAQQNWCTFNSDLINKYDLIQLQYGNSTESDAVDRRCTSSACSNAVYWKRFMQCASLNWHQLYVYVYNTILVSNTAVLCPFRSLLRLLQCSAFVQLLSSVSFLAPAHPGSTGKRAVKWLWCVVWCCHQLSLTSTSRRSLWTDTHPTNSISQWQNKWKSAPVVNSSLVHDPTIQQPGHDLPWCYWALLNRFQTKQDHCASCRKKWSFAATDVPLWQTPNDVKYCQQLPTVQAGGGGCSNCTQLMTLLPNGWRHMARKCTWQQQLVHCPRPSVQGSSLDLLCSQYNPVNIYVTHFTLPTFYVLKC